MTERTTEPTMADVLSAVQGFGETYHSLHLSVQALRDALARHDAESRKDRAGIRELVNALQRSVDKRFDATFLELDTHAKQIQELQQLRTELLTRLRDVEARLTQIEERDLSDLGRRLTALEQAT
jgi:chromosome segregation ATPase